MVGIAGSGKSTFLQTVIEEEPLTEDQRTSTPLLTRPVQTMVIQVHDEVHWKKMDPKERKRYIAGLLRKRAERLNYTDHLENENTVPAPTSSSSAQQPSVTAQPVKPTGSPTTATATAVPDRSSRAAPAEVTLESLLQSSEEDQEYISFINIPSDSPEIILDETIVYIIDSGGQPEFMEAMAVFMGQTSACVLVIDLSESLDDYPLIGYWIRGTPISKPYRCIRTNEQSIKKFIQTVNTFTSKNEGPPSKLLFLGTHRDLAHKCLPETVAHKNERLKKLIPAKFERQIIQQDFKKLIFEINALKPDQKDRNTAEKFRNYILKQCPAKIIEIPVRWDAFEEKLRDMAKGLGRQVMSHAECWRVAQSLGLDEDSFDTALDFFHNWSLMFYFRDPDVVFIDPQVILDKISEIVVFMFELREQEDERLSGDVEAESTTSSDLLPLDWRQFWKFGHVTKAFLQSERFSSHYHHGIFTCEDLIRLMEKLLLLAKLDSDDGVDTWLMPSVLKQVTEEKVKEMCLSPGPLVVDFPDGGPQNGIFCSLMAHVLSSSHPHPHPWKICLSSNQPKCLYRDCIQFHVPDFGSVTLVDCFEYFEAHVSNTTTKEEKLELWQHVSRALFSGIRKVSHMIGYLESNTQPAILCPKSHSDRAHPAHIKNGKWNCTCDMGMRGTLAELDIEFPWCDEACKSDFVSVCF